MREVAFVRSPLGHARVRAVTKPEELAAQVFVAADLIGVEGDPLTDVTTLQSVAFVMKDGVVAKAPRH